MITNDTNDTKSKIMNAAFELFGKYGFAGSSVREISKNSQVNLAAINYHFTNKEMLFWEIMNQIHDNLENQIAQFSSSSKDTKELAMATFDYFVKEKYTLKNVIKMMLTENIKPPAELPNLQITKNSLGPPGGQYFAKKLMEEIPYPLSDEGSLWGVKAVFGTIMHWGMMGCTDVVCDKSHPLMSPVQIRRDVESMLEAQIFFLKNNPSKFKK